MYLAVWKSKATGSVEAATARVRATGRPSLSTSPQYSAVVMLRVGRRTVFRKWPTSAPSMPGTGPFASPSNGKEWKLK